MRPWRRCSILAAAAPRKDTSGPSPVTTGPGAGPILRLSPTPTLRDAARSTRSSCSTTIAASCNATGMRLTRRLRTLRATRRLRSPFAGPICDADSSTSPRAAPLRSPARLSSVSRPSMRSRRRSGAAAPAIAARCGRKRAGLWCWRSKAWLEQQLARVSAKATIAEDIRYALNHRDGLTDGRIELDSNIVERSMRPIVLNRKNALFAGHDQGAQNWACVASLIETCKLNGVDPQAYFTDLITKLVNLWPASRIDELMPWAWAPERCASRIAA